MATKVVYNSGKDFIVSDDIGSVTLKLLVIDDAAGYVPDVDADSFVSDIVSGELSATGYARATLSNVGVSLNSVDDRVEVTADDVTWTGMGTVSGPTIGAVVLFVAGPTDETSVLISALYGIGETLTGGDVTFAFDASGLLRVS